MATHARQQYFADESSLSKEKREFSIAEEVQQKIDSIEEGAQVNTIETIKVNGSEVQPDENKAVDLTIPGVVDSLDSTSSTDALSARQGKVLYDYIQDVSHIGHFLALWDASTGLPVTDPETSPYIYNTGDFYTISNVAPQGGTNYRPDGTQYVIGQASTTVETENVSVNDFYFYDGTTWRHMVNSGAGSIAVDGSLSTTSTNPVENRVITNALNGKADVTDTNTKTFYLSSESDLTTAQAAYDWYLAGKNPLLHLSYDSGGEFYVCFGLQGFNLDFVKPSLEGDFTSGGRTYLTKPGLSINANSSSQVTGITVWPKNRTVGRFLDTDTNYSTPYTPQYPGSPATKKYVDDHAGVTYTAGANIQISAQNVISATDTTYTAGTGISIDANNVISNTQTSAEWGNITGTLSDQTDLQNALNTKADKEDVNVKVFHIASTSDLTNAQAAIDWWEQGRLAGAYTPLIEFGGGKELYGLLSVLDNFQAIFTALTPETTQGTSNTTTSIKQVIFSLTGTPGQPQTVTAISTSNYLDINYLDTSASYSSPYIPSNPGNPATKKYVDDTAAGTVSDTAYANTWDADTTHAPSKNAVYDKISAMDTTISSKAADSDVVKLTGNQTIAGTKTFSTSPVVPSKTTTATSSGTAIATEAQVKTVADGVAPINGMISSNASSSNKLMDKNYIDDSINSVTAYYITKNAQGDQWATYAELAAATVFYSGGVQRTPTKNDYTIVLADENHDNATTRYIYNSSWEYQYTVNETALTQAQLDALNSGITAGKVSTYDGYASTIAGKQDTLISGTNIKTINNQSILGAGNIDTDYSTVKQFAYPSVGSDITDLHNWLYTSGAATKKGAILSSGAGANESNYYEVVYFIYAMGEGTINAERPTDTGIEYVTIDYSLSGGVATVDSITSTNTGVTSVNGQTGAVTVSEFTPGGTATTGYVVTKTASGYEWKAPTGGIAVDSASPIQLTKIWAGTQAQYEALSTYDSTTVYLTI